MVRNYHHSTRGEKYVLNCLLSDIEVKGGCLTAFTNSKGRNSREKRREDTCVASLDLYVEGVKLIEYLSQIWRIQYPLLIRSSMIIRLNCHCIFYIIVESNIMIMPSISEVVLFILLHTYIDLIHTCCQFFGIFVTTLLALEQEYDFLILNPAYTAVIKLNSRPF